MDAHTTIALVHAFTRGARNDKNTAFARTVVSDYLEMNGKRVSSVDAALTAIHAYGLIGSPKANGMPHEEDPVAHHVQELVRVLGESGALEHLRSLTLQYPLLAYRLQQVARQNGLSLPTAGVTIAAACAARHWSALPSASAIPLTPDESAYLAVLRVARKARRSAMARHFRTAVTAFPDSPMLVPTAAAALHRLAALRGWAEGLELLALALKGTGAGSSTEAASVFLTAMYREVGGAVVQQASEVARDAAERVEDGARADSGKVSIYIDGRDGAPDAAALRTHAALTAERAVGGAAESHGAAREAWATLRASVVESIQAMDPLERTLLETMAERIDSAVAADSA
jgi:hypothetical protein